MTEERFDYWERKAECRTEEFTVLLESEAPLRKARELIHDSQRLLDVGTLVLRFLHPLIDEYLVWGAKIDFGTLQGPSLTTLDFSRERFCCFALLTHCLLFRSENRLRHEHLDLDGLYAHWIKKAPTAHVTMRSYDKDNAGVPEALFATHLKTIEPIQQSAGLGWWRRGKDRAVYHRCFALGLVLGMLYDMATQRLDSAVDGGASDHITV